MQLLATLLLMLGAAGGVGFAGFKASKEIKRRMNAVSLIKPALIEMDSPHKVTFTNAFSQKTLDALLDTSTGINAKPSTLIRAIETVLKNASKKDWPDIIKTLIGKGLIHTEPEIRLAVIDAMVQDGLNQDDYEPLMTLLKTEENDQVIEALVKPIVTLIKKRDIDNLNLEEYHQLLFIGKSPGVRSLSISVMEEFPNADAVPLFFKALEQEKSDPLVEKLQAAVAHLATEANNDLLLGNLARAKSPPIQRAAIQGLAALNKPTYFAPIYQSFLENEEKSLNRTFIAALSSLVNNDHLPILFDGLKDSRLKVQDLAIRLLGKLRSDKAVKPLLDYLAATDTKLPKEATGVLANSVTMASRPLLLEIVDSYDPKTEDKEVMEAAVQAIRQLAHPDDLDNLVVALEKDSTPHISKALYEAMEEMGQSEKNFAFLSLALLTSKKARVRIAAALTLDNYGVQALKPLFEALEKTTSATTSGEVDALNKAILKVARDEAALDPLLAKSLSRDERSRRTAEQAVANILEKWDADADYDSSEIMAKLKKLSSHSNEAINRKAKQIHDGFVRDKVRDIERRGGSESFSRSSENYRYLERLRREATEEKIRRASADAIDELDRRRRIREQEEAEERRAAARRAAARSYSSSSSSWGSSGSSGGFSGGGGSFGGHSGSV